MKGSLLACDPGENCGGAYFVDGALVWCGLLSFADATHISIKADRMIVEIPQIYPGPPKKGEDPNDLIGVAVIAGQWIRSVSAPHTRRVFPRQWKGGVEKGIHNGRVLAKLSAVELAVVPKLAASKLHNVIDAIGLGLFDLDRIGRGA